ncbi:hypothetical protein EH240_05075 [Mesorhizobium tamadayense]|uniref:Uncharacterized protein n=1 Tax=Mesorhizobium tamadayense TaxID=425306 RepID=A0A3P3G4Z3_9HYPH|nr:hypothetical protein EH240_05075 [Mesorhizobium tamadayense]
MQRLQNSAPLHSTSIVTAWILGSSPRMTKRRVRRKTRCRNAGSTAPPSALPGISPTRGEIGSVSASRSPSTPACC